ncbi:MAG TPA: S9 family peptidase [Pyrinomonadaceae bacterium]|nr:S9 family peptidase [Pyrinomonadaceae bacterium]
MKTIKLFATSLLILFALSCYASGQQPALIDREIFFGNPEYAGAQISPDGKYISFIKPLNGTMNVWVKGIDEPFSAARPMTNDQKRPVRQYFWSKDSKYILFVQDKGGDENFNVYAINPADKPAEGSPVPAARNLTDAKGIRAILRSVPDSDPDAIYVGINDRDKAWHDLYKVRISTGERSLISENRDRYQGMVFDNADKLRLAVRSAPNGDTEILRIGADGKATKIYDCNAFETCSPIRFHKDNKRVYMQTNKGDVDLIEFVLMDTETGVVSRVESDPLKKVDFQSAYFSNLTDELEATVYEDDRERIYWKDKGLEADYNFIKKSLGGDYDVNFQSTTKDESKFIVVASSDVDPGTVSIFDRKTRKLTKLYQIREKLDRSALSPMKPVRYKSSDGLEIPAFLTIPKGSSGKNLPTVLYIHGGPWGRDFWGYHSYAQFLANRGYAVLQPNFRASTGYGKKFLNAGNNEWGQKMQDDITWGKKFLVEQGIADPKRVAIMGGSYGGYAALAGVTFTPDEYAASVAIVPPSNLQTLLESIPPYWEADREFFYKRMGDPRTPAGLEQMKRQSPLTYADRIKTPLLVAQGANDPRVKQRESDQIVVALRDRNYPVEYILAPDEGHGFARPVNSMTLVAAAEKFLAKHIGGRYQESLSPEVAKRLGEITVDPKTVTLVKKVEETVASGATTGVSSAVNLDGKWIWVVQAPGQPVELSVDIKQSGASFQGTSVSSIGNATLENGKVNGKSMTATLKAVVQGQPMEFAVEGTMDGDKFSGTLTTAAFGSLPFSASRQK